MQESRAKYPRVLGLVLVVAGIGMIVWLESVHRAGSYLFSWLPFLPPILIIVGAATIFEPRLLLVHSEPGIEASFKFYSYVLMVIGAIIGAIIRFTIFQDWQ
jgi:hypothetical protein